MPHHRIGKALNHLCLPGGSIAIGKGLKPFAPLFHAATRCIILSLALIIFSIPAAFAAVDDMQMLLLDRYALPMRWDNIEGPPLWVAGEKPRFDWSKGMHMVRLSAGQSVTVRIPARSVLRVLRPDGSLQPADLEISLSPGSGLYATASPVRGSDSASLFVYPDVPKPMLGRIVTTGRDGDQVTLAFFVMRREPLDEIAPYRSIIDFGGRTVSLRTHGDPLAKEYRHAEPSAPLTARVSGPARLVLEHRIAYPPTESGRLMTYRVFVRLDGRLHQVFDFEAKPDMRRFITIDGKPAVLGTQETGYIAVPAGSHDLAVEVTAPIYGRLLRQDDPDYLVPGLNEPKPAPSSVRDAVAGASPKGSLWDLPFTGKDEEGLRSLIPSGLELTALRTARDMSRRDGGAVASAVMSRAAGERPDYPRLDRAAEELKDSHTFYRPVLPVGKGGPGRQSFRWFSVPSLREFPDLPVDIVAAEQHIQELLGLRQGGYFLPLPPPGAEAYRYLPPKHDATGSLLVAADAPGDARLPLFTVQFDDGEPVVMRLLPGEPVPDEQLETPPARTGEEMLALRHGGDEPVSLSGPFGMKRFPAASAKAGVVELPLPAGTKEIRLRGIGSSADPVSVALFYRASKPFQLSESAFLDALERAGAGEPFRELIDLLGNPAVDGKGGGESISDGPAAARRDLRNELLPLARLIRSLDRQFTASYAEPPDRTAPVSAGRGRVTGPVREKAVTAEKDGQWLAALELWTEVFHASDGDVRREAEFSRVRALRMLGEGYLAERTLRGLFLFGEDEETKSKAFSALEELYKEEEDGDALLALHAAALLRAPSHGSLRTLVVSLVDAGEPAPALAAALLLPRQEQPLAAMLRASHETGWRRVFDRILEGTEDGDERSLWRGQALAEEGMYKEAGSHFRKAGPLGQELAQALENGLGIRDRIRSGDGNERRKAVTDWQTWQGGYPGPRVWREQPQWVTDYAGAASLYALSRDLFSQGYMASPERPVRLVIAGPARLRIEARPLHRRGETRPFDGWMRVSDGKGLSLVPVSNNLPQQGLVIVGDEAHIPGYKVMSDVSYGPGMHQVEIVPENTTIIVRVLAEQPLFASPALPPMTPGTVAEALRGGYRPFRAGPCRPGPLVRDRECLYIIPFDRDRGVSVVGAARERSDTLPVPEEKEIQEMGLLLRENRGTERDGDRAAGFLAAGDVEGALSVPMGEGEGEVLKRVLLLLRLSERKPDQYLRALVEAEALASRHPDLKGLRPLMERMRRNSSWSPVTSVDESAGLRTVDLTGWHPESPFLRTRKALMNSLSGEEYVLYGDGRLVLLMQNIKASTVHVTLAMEDIAYFPAAEMIATYQLDDGETTRVVLTAGQPVLSARIRVPEGRHALGVALEKRLLDQYLRVRILEQDGGDTPLVRKAQRPFHVARKREPITLTVEGPAWLRVDEQRDNLTYPSYRHIAEGLEHIRIGPQPGEEEALVRIHRLIEEKDRPVVPPRFIEVAQEPVPGPVLVISPEDPAVLARVNDAYSPGGQEDGTSSLRLSLVSRRDVDEDTDLDEDERFFEAGISHRYHDEARRRYTFLDLAGRVREDGGPVLGLRGSVYHRLPSYPLSLDLESSLFVQNPDGGPVDPSGGETEWSFLIKARARALLRISEKTYHIPSLSLFGRLLSMSENTRYAAQDVDQDIFTRYKADHGAGLVIADTLYHRPWLDTIWHGGASMTTNENLFVPDHVSVHAGWRQLLGSAQVDALYRFRYYFDDDDRDGSLNRSTIDLNVRYDLWTLWQHRLEGVVNVRYHADSGEFSWLLSLIWHGGKGRGYRDFRPDEIDFADLRLRLVPQEKNNSLSYDRNK